MGKIRKWFYKWFDRQIENVNDKQTNNPKEKIMKYHCIHFLFFVFVFAGCSNVDTRYSDYKIKPEDFKCPVDYFAYCEGRNPTTWNDNA